MGRFLCIWVVLCSMDINHLTVVPVNFNDEEMEDEDND